MPFLRDLLLPLSCALPRSLPGSPRQATVPCQRDCDAAEGKLCHSLLGCSRRRCGHRLRHLTAGIQALFPVVWGLFSLIYQHAPVSPVAAAWSSFGTCLRTPPLLSNVCWGSLSKPSMLRVVGRGTADCGLYCGVAIPPVASLRFLWMRTVLQPQDNPSLLALLHLHSPR